MSTDTQIVRQACLKAAASALSGSGVSADDVCEFAGKLEQWVYASDNIAHATAELNAVPSNQPNQANTFSSGVPKCPKCGSDMWDNRGSKRNPKQPDFKCKEKATCGHGIWT